VKLIYITEDINAVFYSQVVELLNNLIKKDHFDEIVLAIGLRDPDSIKEIETLNPNINLITFKTYPVYPFFNNLTEKHISSIFKLYKVNHDYLIHTRGEHLGALTSKSYFKLNNKLPNLLIDIRGAVFEEVQTYGKMNIVLKRIKLYNHKKKMQSLLKNVKYINAVSNKLKEYIENNFQIESNNISVIPTIAGKNFNYNHEKRLQVRKELEIKENEILFVFSSGSSQAWQNDDDIVNDLVSKGYKVLMLTRKKYNDPNIISKFVPYKEVSSYLNAADIGIIIRNNDVVNNVASPIKFSEYIACGLPIIANDSVESITTLIEQTSFGKIIKLESINQKVIDKLLKVNRNDISKVGKEEFGIKTIINNYLSVYTKIEEELL
jgi:hypothetical protein